MRTRVLAGCWLLIAMLHPAHSLAQAPPSAQEEERELEDLVQILSEETAVATKTRMNGDFVPGIVTVLHGDELLALGIETVWEALALVPGMQAVRDPDATPSVIVRGVDFPFNSGNVKVLVNGVSLSRQNAGLNGIVLQIPIAEVERIEVIRGPGSVVYGDFAFMGLVNILTRRPGARAFLRGSEGEALSGGGSYTWQHAAGRTEASLQAAGFKNGDARVPAPRSAEEERGFGALSLRRGGLSLSAHAVARELRQTAPGAAVSEQTHWALEGRYGFELSSSLRPELRASYLDNHFETRFIGFDGGVAEAGLELPWQAGRHCWLFATSFSHETIDEARSQPPPPPPPPPGAPPRPPLPVTRVRDETRDVFSVTLQDRFDVSERLALTAGARFDHYSDLGDDRVTPRVSLVWRASERNILKLQHAEGFRAPTFFELYSANTRGLGFEINATSELNYVHRRPATVLRATLFRSRIRDMIFIAGPQRFDNANLARNHGLELEWEQQLLGALKLTANLSWVDEEDDRNLAGVIRATPPSSNWLGGAALLWRGGPRTLLTARLSHVGDRHAPEDPRGYDLLDLGFTWNGVALEGLQLRAGVKNLLDEEVRDVFTLPIGNQILRFPGRTLWVQLSWSR